MTRGPDPRATLDQFAPISQQLEIVCRACSGRHTYDVGTICRWKLADGEDPAMDGFAFCNYFHCRDCGSPGPWTVASPLKFIGMMLRGTFGDEKGVTWATPKLFDGTIVQTPAMGEAHLLRLISQEPKSAFLHTRLGNLLRGCQRRSDAVTWYAKALALDATDLEARYNVFCLAADAGDDSAAAQHALTLVRHLLEGCTTTSAELTRDLAISIVALLREAPPGVRALLLDASGPGAEAPERCFLRTLLEQEGDEDRIVNDAAERLLNGIPVPEPVSAEGTLTAVVAEFADEDGEAGPPLDPISSLADLVEEEGLNVRKLTVAAPADPNGRIHVPDRRKLFLFDGKRTAIWQVSSLQELFRGNQAPPPDVEQFPPSYVRAFFCLEKHVLILGDAASERTDQEMERIYSALRRRPDGNHHLGAAYDFLWQAAALMLGMHRLSAAEFAAIASAVEHSVRRWALRPVSRNYAEYLRQQTE